MGIFLIGMIEVYKIHIHYSYYLYYNVVPVTKFYYTSSLLTNQICYELSVLRVVSVASCLLRVVVMRVVVLRVVVLPVYSHTLITLPEWKWKMHFASSVYLYMTRFFVNVYFSCIFLTRYFCHVYSHTLITLPEWKCVRLHAFLHIFSQMC